MAQSGNLTGKHLMRVDRDGMAFIRLSDCKLVLYPSLGHRWKKRHFVIQRLLILWQTLENRHIEMLLSQPREPEMDT